MFVVERVLAKSMTDTDIHTDTHTHTAPVVQRLTVKLLPWTDCSQRLLLWIVAFVYLSLATLLCDYAQALNSEPYRLAIYAQIFNSSLYDPNTRPGFDDQNQRVEVDLQYRVNLLYGVSTPNEIFSLDLYVRETWIDPRLVFNETMWPDSLGAMRIPSSKIWRPDTFFFNAVSCSTGAEELVTLDYTGRVLWVRHQSCTFHVSFDLTQFPFDTQVLSMSRLSFGYNAQELLLQYNSLGCYTPPPDQGEGWENQLWDLNSFSCQNFLKQLRPDQPNYAEVIAQLIVSRHWQTYVIKEILPMFVIVLLSTFTYWVDPLSAPARVGGSVTLVLSIVTFNLVVSNDLPKINYATLLDWYVWECFLFVIFSVAEFSFVNHLLTAKNSAGNPRFNPALGYGIDDWCQYTVGVLWILSNVLYWPIVTNVFFRIFVGALEFSYFLLNLYRCHWNFMNGQRGLVLYGIWLRELKEWTAESLQQWREKRKQKELDDAVRHALATGK